jgi:hypothetical protein
LKPERHNRAKFGEIAPVGQLENALVDEAREGRLPCASVFRIAATLGVPAAEAGRSVQRLGIKVTGCQLGCF